MAPARGHFITLEGGEGVGKSTLMTGLAAELRSRGLGVLETREPGGSAGGEALRKLILDPPENVTWSALSQTLLFNAARRNHLDDLIEPALARGDWTICDRFSDSTRAYQAAAGGVAMEDVLALENIAIGVRGPDLTLILDMPIDTAADRRRARGGPLDPFEAEDEAFHERARMAFLAIAEVEPERCVVIDASQSAEAVLSEALTAVEMRFDGASVPS
ncbi:MAG: dTMP kinase [Pseudomonadota bacterium]